MLARGSGVASPPAATRLLPGTVALARAGVGPVVGAVTEALALVSAGMVPDPGAVVLVGAGALAGAVVLACAVALVGAAALAFTDAEARARAGAFEPSADAGTVELSRWAGSELAEPVAR